jgi:hypothetical protein
MLSPLAILTKRKTTSCNSVKKTEEKNFGDRKNKQKRQEQQDSKVTNLQAPHRR